MRFVKPKKGFRLSRNLGLLLFSTAVISGSLSSDNKAYGLEAPSLPPSVLMASAKNGETNSSNKVVKPSVKKDVKEVKSSASSKENKAVSDVKTASVVNKNSEIKVKAKETEAAPAPIVKQIPEEDTKPTLTPAVPPSLLVNSVKNQETNFDDDEDDIVDDDFSIKGDEPKPSSNLIASAKIVENNSSSAVLPKSSKEEKAAAVKESAPVEKKADLKAEEKKESQKTLKVVETPVKKAEVKPAEKTVSNDSAKKEIVKPAPKASDIKPVEVKKAEIKENNNKPEIKKHSKVRRVSKKVVVEDNECPPEWDWFSAPLVFVRDANGKLVIMADKNAPKIVIPSRKTSDNEIKSVRPVKAENKVAQVKKPVVKTVKKAESPEYVEVKPFEAPAAPAVEVEPKPVVEEKTIEAQEETPAVSYAKPVVMVETKNAEETKPLFAEASEKMARIKRLHSYDENKTVEVASTTKRSASMVRMHKLIVELIKRTDKKPNKDNRLLKASISPQAPPEANNAESSVSEDSSDSSNQTSSDRYAFRPYYNPNFSANLRVRAY